LNLSADSSDLMSDDIGSMFIQCDSCKVWQHGGCVGIMDEAMSPDEYFCEECRKDLHKIKNESNGYVSSNLFSTLISRICISLIYCVHSALNCPDDAVRLFVTRRG
jgi:hypothetical protein